MDRQEERSGSGGPVVGDLLKIAPPPYGSHVRPTAGPLCVGPFTYELSEQSVRVREAADAAMRSVVERSGHGSVPPGATLELRTSPGPKGPQVTDLAGQAGDDRAEAP